MKHALQDGDGLEERRGTIGEAGMRDDAKKSSGNEMGESEGFWFSEGFFQSGAKKIMVLLIFAVGINQDVHVNEDHGP